MNESPDMTVEILTIITSFLSDNSTAIAVVLLLYIFREAVSGLISRLTSFFYENGDSKVGIEAVPVDRDEKKTAPLEEAVEKPDSSDAAEKIQEREKDQNWFFEMHKAFSDGRIEDADAAFKAYALDEKDESKLEENKALYLYFKFEKGKDNTAIEELEKLASSVSTEESRFSVLTWLSFCLSDSKQHKKAIKIWRSAKSEAKSSSLITRATVNLAYALNKDNQANEAKAELLKRLKETEEDEQLSSLYEALSTIELSLGNKTISVYCKDKSLEYGPSNRDELFNSAYAASNEDVDEISISNYVTLISIDSDNSTALNNLGVRAQEAGLKIIATDNYKKSASLKNTLAMANQGYLLLGAGFVSEAEEIAQQALEEKDTHQNIYSLLAAIHEQKEKQKEKWDELSSKALSRQKSVRTYLEQYYLGKSELLEGAWILNGKHQVSIKIEVGSFKASWIEELVGLSVSTYAVELIGKVTGSTFSGTYKRKRTDGAQTGLLGVSSDARISCIGFLTQDENALNIVASSLKEDLCLFLSRAQA
jgi:tetratricopeptide (TPR) repeat protein